MADEEEEAEKPKGKKNLILLILVGVNMLGMAGVAAYVLFLQPDPAQADPADQAEVPEAAASFGPLVELNPIVANLQTVDGTRYVKVALHFEVASEEDKLKLEEELLIPVRDRALLYFSGISVEGTIGEERKTEIKAELIELTNEVVGREMVRNIYFAEFVVQ